jgi:pyruvate,water dikinase
MGWCSTYGGQPYTIRARYYEDRPPVLRGSEMDAGIAFGIRDEGDFGLVEQNALHDVLRLDDYIHARRRDLRDKLFRTHADEWHTLEVSVSGATVTAGVDGQTIFTVADVPDTDGPIGLWARAAAATRFSEVSVQVGQGA